MWPRAHKAIRRNGSAWEFLAIDTKPHYLDDEALHTPNTPETREYRMSFWGAGDPNGDWTAVTKVMVGAWGGVRHSRNSR